MANLSDDVQCAGSNHDHYQEAACAHHEDHIMHDSVQLDHVVDSHADYTSDSNIILYDQYVKDNEVPVVHSDVSSVPTDAFTMIYDDMCEPYDQSVSYPSRNTAVQNSLTAELATYKEHNPLCLTRAKQVQPALYNGHEIIKDNHKSTIVHHTEDTLEIAEITRKKMNDKMNDPECVTRKACYLQEVIPFFKTLKDIFEGIQKVLTKEVKETKDVFEELEAEVAQYAVDRKHDAIELKNLLIANDNLIPVCLSQEVFCVATNFELNVARFTEMHGANNTAEARCLALEAELANLRDIDNRDNQRNKDTPDFDSVFVIGKMQASLQGKDNHYKELYDSIKITHAKHIEQVTKLTTANVNLKTSVSKATVNPQVSARDKHAIDVEPVVPRLRNNRDAHLYYLRHLKESVETIRDIVEEAKVVVANQSDLVSHKFVTQSLTTALSIENESLIEEESNFEIYDTNQASQNREQSNKMAELNAPSGQTPAMAPPLRADDQILPHIRWVPIGKSNCYLDLEKSESNPIYKIAVDLLKNTNFFRAFTASSIIPSIYIQQFWDTFLYDKKAGCYRCQLDEQWFVLTKETLREARHITSRRHRFHPRPDSPPHLPNEEHVLRYLKFSAKDTKREVFVRSAQPAPTSAPAKPQERKRKQATKTSNKPPKEKKSKHGWVADEDDEYQKVLDESMKDAYALPRGTRPPVVIREPGSGKYQPLTEVPGKGKAKVTEELSDSEEESKKVVLGVEEGGQDEGQAGPDPGDAEAKVQSIPSPVVHAGSDREHMNLDVADVSPQPSTEQLDEGFTATAYPKVQDNLKLVVEEQVLLEEPASSLGPLSSLQHLSRDFSFGDQFFSDKPLNADKNAETKVESMVNVTIQQALSSISLMTSPIIDLTLRPESPKEHQQLKATTTNTTTTTTTFPSPQAPQQSTTEAMMVKHIGELEHIMADLIQVNKDMEERLDSHGSRLHTLEQLDIPQQVSIVELAQDLAEARKKKKKSHESPKMPPGSPSHQPPPPPSPVGPSGASGAPGASGSAQVLPSPPPLSSTNQESSFKGSVAPNLEMDEDMAPDEQAQSSNDEDIRSAHILTVNLRKGWWKPFEEERPATLKPAWSIRSSDVPVLMNNWASALASNYSPPPEDSLLAQTDDIATFMDWFCKRRGITELKPQDLEGPAYEIIKCWDFTLRDDIDGITISYHSLIHKG
nr:hypothetical protein [Tanacetum cinerariifolium]